MATDFIEVAKRIRLEIYTRVNIAMYDAEGTASWPADAATGALKVHISVDELKNMAELKRMRKQYSKGKGGFFPRLISVLNSGDDNFYASEASDGSLRVIYFPDIPKDKQYQWTDLKVRNDADMQANRLEVENSDDYSDDYRFVAECPDIKFREWEY
ncbi:hypothetical protein SNR37_003148 [Agarivorans aestuarii]|uniref:Phage tail protein n=1 Tax=Agarivorans aestuarii TaxID=1563703 RepID=A0ABU7G3B4_9ALTE|nr:hypothetical protein [Agarivorans aestuarii]MEE1673721.1 hypothetical protein [Agarivorans aestuarii]